MKSERIHLWRLVVAILCATSHRLCAAGDTPSSAPATTNATRLDELVAETLEKNPELEFYRAELLAARGGRKSAGRPANPEVSGSVGHKRAHEAGGAFAGEGMAWSVSVAQPFDWPGRVGLRKAIANRDIELAELGYARFKIALAGRVRSLAYGLLAAQEKSAAAAEVAERFKALREVLVQRDPAGLTPLLETRVIEATELNAQRKASEALLAAQAALLELNQLRGIEPDTRLAIGPAQFAFRPPQDINALLALARTNNFELRVRAVELAQQGFRVDLAQNERFPSIAVAPTISEEHAGGRERIVGVGLTLPLPLWNRNTGNIETAKARQLLAEVSLRITESELQRKVIQAASVYETKLHEMARWRPDAVLHFREAAEMADRHYQLGAVPISTYVELQKQYLEAVESLLDTKKEAFEAAQHLELLTGASPPLTYMKEEQK